jgi:hypothetical protein
MLALFIITTVALAIFCFIRELKHSEMKESRDFWFDRWEGEIQDNTELIQEMAASEQGIAEIEENYQQELLSEYDKVTDLVGRNAHLHKLVDSLETIRLDHDVHCLPAIGKDFYPNAEDDETPIYDSVQPHPALF